MKKIFYGFLLLFFSVTLQAQNVRKIPFLPYLQANGAGGAGTADAPFQNDAPASLRKVATIYFPADQWSLKKEDIGTLQSVVSQAAQQNAEIYLYSYSIPDMSPDLPLGRLGTVQQTINDINPTVKVYKAVNQRVNPIITPHRVEIFLK